MRKILFITAIMILTVCAQSQNTSWKKQLGYTDEDILLIIHGDDLGVNHSVNLASIDGLENGWMNSVSIMVPCPWFEEIAAYFVENPNYDYGLHLTLTSEWKYYKWDGLTGKHVAPGLHNEYGYLYPEVAPVVENASVEEVEAEVRAQIEKALKAGLKPSHLDSHMGTLFAKPAFLKVMIKLGEEYKIPAFLPIPKEHPLFSEVMTEHSVLVETLYMNSEHLEKENIFAYYDDVIMNLKPGLNEIIVHLGKDNEELQATCIDHPYYGSSWRQFDWDYIKSDHLKVLLEQKGVKLVTWREIQKAIYPE